MPSTEVTMWWVRLLLLGCLTVILGDATWDKVTGWAGNAKHVQQLFAKTLLKPIAVPLLMVLSAMMALATVGCVGGIAQLLLQQPPWLGFWGAVMAALTFLSLLFGQQVGKNHPGANAIIPLFVVAVLAVWAFVPH